MSGSKASVIEKINRMPDEMNGLEHSRQRCQTEGTFSDEDVSEYFRKKREMHANR